MTSTPHRPILTFLMGSVVALAVGTFGVPAAAQQDVDLELVLAVDISWSITGAEQDIQRRGYAAAFEDDTVIETIISGIHGKIAVTYLEWGGDGAQRQVLPWTLIDSPESSKAFSRDLAAAPINRSGETSISGGLTAAASLLNTSPYSGIRRIIDISGDGPNNSGLDVVSARARVLAQGITINGLPLAAGGDAEKFGVDIAHYYRDCVIGGPASFMFQVSEWTEFSRVLKGKLVLEISGLVRPDPFPVHLAVMRKPTDCLIGEKIEREKYLRMLDEMTNGRSKRWQPREEDWPTPKSPNE